MSRLRLNIVSSVLAVFAVTLAPAISSAQDVITVAADAQKQIGAIQKLLAGGKDVAGKANPLLMQLRVDSFKAIDDKVQAGGVFIDPGAKANGDIESQVGDVAKDLILKHLGVEKQIAFSWKDMKLVGVIDDNGDPVGDVAPHIILQNAANATGARGAAATDQIRFDRSHFGPDGGLVITGARGKGAEVEKWITGALRNLEKHPAAMKGGKAHVSTDVKVVDWKASVGAIQSAFAAAGKANGTEKEKNQFVLRRLLVERAYFAYDAGTLRFRIEGLRLGDAGVDEVVLDEVLEPIVVAEVGKKIPLNKKNILSDVLEEPLKEVRGAVSDTVALDGVRIDPGFSFGPVGELQLVGVQPGLTDEAKKSLEVLVQGNFLAYGKGKPLAVKYETVAKRPVSVRGMTVLPIGKVMTDLRKWAIRTKDDLKVQRLYFPTSIDALKHKYFVAADGLVLLYKPANLADVKDVEYEFKRILKVHIATGIPAAPIPVFGKDGGLAADKEPLLPGLTAFLRKEMAGDQKKWNGSLIERGFFEENGLFTLRAVVESNEQSTKLAKRIEELKADPKWAEYFTPKFNSPELTVIPMRELVDRVKRVTPAYSTLDGIRIESARYDADANLIFEAHLIGNLDREAAPLLAKLVSDHPTYGRRGAVGKQVKIIRFEGSPYSDDQIGKFNLDLGGKLMEKANSSKEDKQKAKEWLDAAQLYYPNHSSVWFLSAYYNHAIEKDQELSRRDLFRVIELESSPGSGGSTQRKRRYEVAKDLQGTSRNELEKLWLDCSREAKDGAKPMTLKK